MVLKKIKEIEKTISSEETLEQLEKNIDIALRKGDISFFMNLFYESVSEFDDIRITGRDICVLVELILNTSIKEFKEVYKRKALVGFWAVCRKLEIIIEKNIKDGVLVDVEKKMEEYDF